MRVWSPSWQRNKRKSGNHARIDWKICNVNGKVTPLLAAFSFDLEKAFERVTRARLRIAVKGTLKVRGFAMLVKS